MPYIKDERVKILRYVTRFPHAYKDRIEFDEAKNLEDTIWKMRCYYEKSKPKTKLQTDWIEKGKPIFRVKGKKIAGHHLRGTNVKFMTLVKDEFQ